MRELKDDLASLRIDREAPHRNRWRVPLLVLVLLAILVVGGFYYQRAHPVFGAIEVETFQPIVESSSGPNAGTPILTASGYLVARHQSVVSSKIQGRISELRVEEGSVVQAGEVLATLDNQDALAAIVKAKADIDYAKADLAESQRQERLQEDLYKEKVVSQDALDAANAKVKLAASLSGLHRRARAVRRNRSEEDDRGRRERGAHSARRDYFDVVGRDRRHRRHELA
jgi:multidrug efflux pump subunit AcrA (membrane-fusion protein)